MNVATVDVGDVARILARPRTAERFEVTLNLPVVRYRLRAVFCPLCRRHRTLLTVASDEWPASVAHERCAGGCELADLSPKGSVT